MKIRLLLVGKPRDRRSGLLHDDYAERMRRLGADYGIESVPDVRPGGQYSELHALERETAALLDRIGAAERGTTIALDREGRMLDSLGLAERLERWASPRATFVIGGPLGLHERFLRRADWRWSLSPLTFPHELTRVVVAEQLYRALTILRGMPYHK